MARQTNLLHRGTWGQLVFYEMNGGYYVRTKPVRVIQTPATRACAGKFGLAVRTGKSIRTVAAPLLPDAKDRQLMFRLNTAIYQWLLAPDPGRSNSIRPIDTLTDFCFNEKTALTERIKPALQVNWQGQGPTIFSIQDIIPQKDITAPAHTQSVDLQIIAGACRLADQNIMGVQSASVSIPYTNVRITAQQLHFDFISEPGCICLVAAALKYNVLGKYGMRVESKSDWLAAGIVSAVFTA